jgi:hypothetical protein
MKPHLTRALLALSLLLPFACSSSKKSKRPTPVSAVTSDSTIGDKTKGMQRIDGFLTLYWDPPNARLFFELPEPEKEVLYYVSLPGGLGSNSVGLERGQLGWSGQVEFRRIGPRVFLVAPNLRWRSSSTNAVERLAVEDAFAMGVLESFDIVAEEEGRVLVEGTPFFLGDAHSIVRKLDDRGQGSFSLTAKKSTLLPEKLASFEKNTEIEALLTFESERPGPEVRSTAALPSSVSLRVRHSFVQLPDRAENPFRSRRFDPRSGYFPFTWNDLSVPIDEPVQQVFITRHHLSANEPIVYFVDRAAPEPVRTALLEGARYWEEAFEQAGFPEGFRVELLPADADPQDVRYNVIQWVPRSTRGWSYGMSVCDPRTGEILKGHVTLGALRVRQDVLLFEGLLSPYGDVGDDGGGAMENRVVLETALDRIRQLSAHEVGHTLGLAHNFASSLEDRASVMDYPAPEIRIDEHGEIDLSGAYKPGGGIWDGFAIRYGYTPFAPGLEAQGLSDIISEAKGKGLTYLTDRDARGSDRAHPRALLWDTGSEPLTALETTYSVRRRALARFSANAVKPGRSFFDLERALAPLYYHHRYQLEAVVRQIGGRSFDYAVVGRDENPNIEAVAANLQRQALLLTLESIRPGFLALPPRLIELLPPPPPGSRRDRETFRATGGFFDPLEAAAAAIDLTLGLLLDPARAARLLSQVQRDGTLPSLAEVLEHLTKEVWGDPEEPPVFSSIREVLQARTLEHLLSLASLEDVHTRVRAAAFERLAMLNTELTETPRPGAHAAFERERLRRFFEDPTATFHVMGGRIPPGSPIGSFQEPACGKRP